MIADDLATYLQENLVFTENKKKPKKGSDLFVNGIDSSKTEAILITDTGSADIDSYLSLDDLTVQVMVLSKKHNTAKSKALDIYKLINRKQGLTAGDKTFGFVIAMQTPYFLSRESGVTKIVTNYKITTCIE